MEGVKEEVETLSLDDWLDKIISIHGRPCYILLGINEEGKVRLLSASGESIEAMGLTLAARPNYMG